MILLTRGQAFLHPENNTKLIIPHLFYTCTAPYPLFHLILLMSLFDSQAEIIGV